MLLTPFLMPTQSKSVLSDIESHLDAAATAARHALGRARPEFDSFLSLLTDYDMAVKASSVNLEDDATASVRKAVNAYQSRYDELVAVLDNLVVSASETLQVALADIERDAHLVTIMLFGRTRAGKSTTMEALTGGDGATIGVGRQHTTKDIREYYFPKLSNRGARKRPALRIVDTPGIEGFEGQALGAMAEEFVQRSDHILFLLSDDKATADELDRFGSIKTQGKGVTVLLNVKATDANLDLLVSHPEMIFKVEEIAGHTRRITGYLEKHFEIPPPRLIPIHARAGWIGKRQADLPDEVEDRETLIRNSRLPELEARIAEFIQEDAVPARLCAPHDLLLGYIYPLKQELSPFSREFSRITKEIRGLAGKLERGAERARKQASSRFPLLRNRYQAAADLIPGMVDTIITEGGRGAALRTQRKQLWDRQGLSDASAWFTNLAGQDFDDELAEQIRVDAFDYEFSQTEDFDELFGGYLAAEKSANKQKYARAAMRTVGGAGAGALATWAVANWWNPTGWAAAVGALVVVGTGVAGSEAARLLTEKLEKASRKEMMEKRSEIVSKLREQLWSEFAAVRDGCNEWLDKTKSIYTELAQDLAGPISMAAQKLSQATRHCLQGADEIGDRVNALLVNDLFQAIVPECAAGRVQLLAVAREPGYRTKVIVVSNPSGRVNAIAACIGKQGQRINQIRRALGNEIVDLVDGTVSIEAQISQALGVIRGEAPDMSVQKSSNTVQIRFKDPSQVRAALGSKGSNLRLAQQLCGLNILVEGK